MECKSVNENADEEKQKKKSKSTWENFNGQIEMLKAQQKSEWTPDAGKLSLPKHLVNIKNVQYLLQWIFFIVRTFH